jgi:co-chaperonin GroES (HSP10)
MNRPIYSFPEFKEPEKTTSWADKDKPTEPRIELVDKDLEAAKRRTALIREHMSPPGELGLCPALEAQRLKYGITDAFFKVQASFDRIFVFPIDAEEGDKAEKTTGGIYKPATTKLRDKQEGNRGVLISAGLTAMDRLMSHGIEIGDIVITNKNVPFARRCESISNEALHYLVMRDGDLAGSETLMERIRAGKQRVVEMGGEGGYQHQVAAVREDGTLDVGKKQSVYLNDTW